MFKDLIKKFKVNEEPEELDTGYDSDYYGGTYAGDRDERDDRAGDARVYGEDSAAEQYAPRSYDERYDNDREPGEATRVYTPRSAQGTYRRPENRGTLYFTPESYEEVRAQIVTGLVESHVVVVNVRYLERGDLLRLFDYVMGAAHALEADMSRLDGRNILLCPKGVEIDTEELVLADDEDGIDEEEMYSEDDGEDDDIYEL
ncbi:MAG: cell division protein SepF [Ruminococcaceae bacterium]|nr:cell division protein SepF [Oscillospiraceae bacterium]